jgi:hypothetical protein
LILANYSETLTKEFLQEYYVEKKMFAKDIAKLVGCSLVTVTNYLRKHEIEVEQRYAERDTNPLLNPARLKLTDEYIQREYIQNGRNFTSIAYELGCSALLVKQIILEKGYEVLEENHVTRLKGAENPIWTCGVQEENGYLVVYMPTHHLANPKGYVRLHRVLAEYYFGRKLEEGEEVHHKDENKWNNLPENLEILTKGEHTAEHNRRRAKQRRELKRYADLTRNEV